MCVAIFFIDTVCAVAFAIRTLALFRLIMFSFGIFFIVARGVTARAEECVRLIPGLRETRRGEAIPGGRATTAPATASYWTESLLAREGPSRQQNDGASVPAAGGECDAQSRTRRGHAGGLGGLPQLAHGRGGGGRARSKSGQSSVGSQRRRWQGKVQLAELARRRAAVG